LVYSTRKAKPKPGPLALARLSPFSNPPHWNVSEGTFNTPEVRGALDLLESHTQPKWLIPKFRHHALKEHTSNYVQREGQRQVLRATFP
jgi:hypothetical protein